MQVHLNMFEDTVYEMYVKLRDNGLWPGEALEDLPGKGAPHVHDIVVGMGCMPEAKQFKKEEFCPRHETVADGTLGRATGKPCLGCLAEKADGMKASQSPPQAATNLTRTTEFGGAVDLNGHRHIEQQPSSYPIRPRPYPTPETEEQSTANSAAMSRQPSRHAPNSHGNPMDMNGPRHHNSGLAGFPPLYKNMEQDSMLNPRMQHPSYGAHTGGFDPNHGFGNSATHSGTIHTPVFDLENTTFGFNATGIDPSFNADGSFMGFRNPDVAPADPFMGGPPTRSAQNQFMEYINRPGSSTNRPLGTVSPAMSANNRLMGALENIDRMPPDPQRAGNSFGISQGNWDDNFDFSQYYQTEWEGDQGLVFPDASQ